MGQAMFTRVPTLVLVALFPLGVLVGVFGERVGSRAPSAPAPAPAASCRAAPVEVAFSPGHACTEAAVATIESAERELLVDAYGFSNTAVLGALKRARA